jgi:hypothetical protein
MTVAGPILVGATEGVSHSSLTKFLSKKLSQLSGRTRLLRCSIYSSIATHSKARAQREIHHEKVWWCDV